MKTNHKLDPVFPQRGKRGRVEQFSIDWLEISGELWDAEAEPACPTLSPGMTQSLDNNSSVSESQLKSMKQVVM